MSSLRRRLFVLLMVATGVIWLCAVGWIYFSSRAELQHVLDTRLQEAARMVHSLVASGNVSAAATVAPIDDVAYTKQLSCQIWSFDGRLVARSSGAPDQSLAQNKEGFADRDVGGESWRIYTIVDQHKGVRVAVGDRIGLRNQLVRDLVTGLVAPALLIAPLLGLMIWASLGRGLKPLNVIAGDIARRDGEDMQAIALNETPSEVRPLLAALNGLFGKVEAARRHEREVAAFAAHELRTPLAGLKTQVQVALAATDAAIREKALRQVLVSVDRTARLARQLLALAKLEASAVPSATETTNAGSLLREVVAECAAPAGLSVEVDPALDGLSLKADRESLQLIVRNLHENAVAHASAPGRIRWTALAEGNGIAVTDEGPGIPEDELPLVAQRFYRGRNRTATGTGLGLTIAKLAADRVGAQLSLLNRGDRSGMTCRVIWRRGTAPT
ncbi:ATP-binding protein [Bosea sp. AS-1]|uniref:ATP-binding protein n=1 Tax=Bosea sp. AS-1 TaxID=2015316 RepID=UPI000B795625|nr:ATP-binding protein [Bosea sp. AS-1]